MILVDSSAFIEFYRPSGSSAVSEAVAASIAADLVAVNGVIQTEIVSFAAGKADFGKLWSDFRAFHWLPLDRAQFDQATHLGAELRSKGITVPATDLIIAASAIDAGAELYHVDAHFDAIAAHSELAATNLL